MCTQNRSFARLAGKTGVGIGPRLSSPSRATSSTRAPDWRTWMTPNPSEVPRIPPVCSDRGYGRHRQISCRGNRIASFGRRCTPSTRTLPRNRAGSKHRQSGRGPRGPLLRGGGAARVCENRLDGGSSQTARQTYVTMPLGRATRNWGAYGEATGRRVCDSLDGAAFADRDGE